jgi:curved DNA-binding protein
VAQADFYQDLGVARDASDEEIKKSYRKLAAKLHPDKHPGDKKIESRFKAVNRAYHVLSDPQKRKLYDEFGEDGLREGFDAEAARAYRRAAGAGGRVRFRRNGGSGGFEEVFGAENTGGFADLFGDLFRNRGGRGAASAMRGSDIASEVTVDFVSAIQGAELRLTLQDGGEPVTVRIPPGAGDGDKVRIPGHGAPGNFGGPPGDLVLAIRVKPHPFFERDGLDLHLDLPITVREAFYGAKIRVPTPSGDVTLTVPKHAQSGQVVRLKGRGVKRKADQGDLYVRFLIKLPDSDSPELERAVEALESAMSGDVRAGIQY